MKTRKAARYLWEIIVPVSTNGRKVPVAHHRLWDEHVREVSNGLTILGAAKGHWVSPSGELHIEEVIPVRFICTSAEMKKIAKITGTHYMQEAVMFYRLSSKVTIMHFPQNKGFAKSS